VILPGDKSDLDKAPQLEVVRVANIIHFSKDDTKFLFPWTKYKLFYRNKNTAELHPEFQIRLPWRLWSFQS